jgi:hypothetical protein
MVLLGSHHPVTLQHRAFRDMLVNREQRLELIVTRDPTYRHLIPALLGRTIQIEVNHWLQSQARSALPVTFAPLTEVFHDIDRHKQWEPMFPMQYLNVSKPHQQAPISIIQNSAASTASTSASTLTGSTGSAMLPAAPISQPQPSRPVSTLVRHMAYNEAVFGKFKSLGHKAQAIKAQVRKNHVAYPKNTAGNNMCMSFHVLGVCNDTCRQASDHGAHTAAEDDILRTWCEEHYKIE